jgi:hypothetical protein
MLTKESRALAWRSPLGKAVIEGFQQLPSNLRGQDHGPARW